MTRTEFYLRAMLAMAANPKYSVENNEDDHKDSILSVDAIAMDAARLTDAAENEWDRPFDIDLDETISTPKSILGDISNTLVAINDNIRDLGKE